MSLFRLSIIVSLSLLFLEVVALGETVASVHVSGGVYVWERDEASGHVFAALVGVGRSQSLGILGSQLENMPDFDAACR
ncbi:MAG: hypothetical protein AAFX06_27250, partial [Planctomycetota bacterium]